MAYALGKYIICLFIYLFHKKSTIVQINIRNSHKTTQQYCMNGMGKDDVQIHDVHLLSTAVALSLQQCKQSGTQTLQCRATAI